MLRAGGGAAAGEAIHLLPERNGFTLCCTRHGIPPPVDFFFGLSFLLQGSVGKTRPNTSASIMMMIGIPLRFSPPLALLVAVSCANRASQNSLFVGLDIARGCKSAVLDKLLGQNSGRWALARRSRLR
jgi:hypothetical protein